ncbi:Acyl-CoA dehydrogenase, short-chain specific [[Actinomadura] parvosata subsp. kistnae]|uniref:Acyl-CoA dehydrogenase n=1 Tax=[Actinomadura] parvosata subsp. kistnae TaxID=1909395 RepID=A0A1V0AGG5_9ACTN|nr:acyl-CoA dehydrogenase family protein [Nonomuraea sp. ATCC 55076]AQZ69283.1 acyl-CoA dehydrogenase [Nonomuraea sp. ATCC 55076]SPL92088.1 Acyl-CoA dehydrogenase, short-chain specific [Actinomadura parvosata subsp. kistnae]
MTLLYSEVEEELRASVRGLLADRCPPAAVLKRIESEPTDLDLWKTLAGEIGVAGLLIPEELGGAGAGPAEAAVVLEELGRAVAPVPFLTSAVLATQALLPTRDALLGELAEGRRTAALAVSFAASPYVPGRGSSVTVDGEGRLSGTVTGVAGADVADVLLVPVDGDLYAAEGAAVEVVPSLDLTRPVATVTFARTPARRVGACDVAAVLRFGAGLLASEQLGVAEWCLETTLAYVKERHQFARPVGSFQAIKHRLADLWLDVVRARAAARNAVADASSVSVAVAQAWNAGVAVHAAEEALQLHGGIGMTWEHPVHLYLKRAKATEIALGTPGDHRAALASLVDVPGPGVE